MIWDAVIVGGGCAGLAAGTRLAEAGKRVLVLERRPLLGGRASSYKDPQTGETLDNGQHLFLGCYEETKQYLRRIGTLDLLPFNRSFAAAMAGPGGRARLKAAWLPAPFHFAWALLRYKALSLRERWAVVRVARAAASTRPEDLAGISAAAWLARLGQSAKSRERFWDLLILATINVDPERASAELLAVVLRDGFLASAAASSVGLSKVGLSDLHGEPSRRYIRSKGGEVRVKAAVKKFHFDRGRVTGVELADGSVERGWFVVSAVPPPAAGELVRESAELKTFLAPAARLIPSPIVSLNVWLDRRPFEAPFVGLWGGEFHWVFRKSEVCGDPSLKHVTLVTSAAEKMLGKTKEELTALAEKELRLAGGVGVKVERATVSRESAATWVPPLGDPHARLPLKTPVENFFLAGDWTRTGLPATIEGAVKSGHAAARAVVDAQGPIR